MPFPGRTVEAGPSLVEFVRSELAAGVMGDLDGRSSMTREELAQEIAAAVGR